MELASVFRDLLVSSLLVAFPSVFLTDSAEFSTQRDNGEFQSFPLFNRLL